LASLQKKDFFNRLFILDPFGETFRKRLLKEVICYASLSEKLAHLQTDELREERKYKGPVHAPP
jgi:hypothetical protein